MWSVTGARKWQRGAGPWQLSKGEMKAQAAWAVKSGGDFFFPPLPFQMKDGQERSTLVMATGAAPSQPHISSQSHLVDRGSLTQSLRVPEEPVDSSSTAQASLLSRVSNRCHRLLFLLVVMHHPRNFSPVCFFILLKDCFEGVGKRRCWQETMSQSTLTVTWWPETINASPYKDCSL